MCNQEIMEQKKKKRVGNKGFSLVELIVVMAIMAILIGVVGMQVLPYIESSRQSKDSQIISGVCTAANSAFSTKAADVDTTEDFVFTLDDAADTVTTGDGTEGNIVITEMRRLLGINAATTTIFDNESDKFESDVADNNANQIVVDYDGATGLITVTLQDGTGADIEEIEVAQSR